MIINRVEVWAVGPTVTRYTWSHDLPEQFMTNTIVRIFTDQGLSGTGAVANYTSYDYDRYAAETIRHMIPDPDRQGPTGPGVDPAGPLATCFPTGPGSHRGD